MFAVGPYSGCAAAASNANHVFRSVAALQRVLSPNMPSTAELAKDDVAEALTRLDRELVRGGEEPGYHLIIGSYTQDETAVILCVGDASQVDGQEKYVDWGVSIGLREYADVFDRNLREGIAKTLATGNDLGSAADQALAVGVALHDCVKADLHPGIGGGVQIALITPERGYQRLEMSLWRRNSNVIDVLAPQVSRDPRSRPPAEHIPVDLIRLAREIEEDEDMTRR